MEAGWGWGWLPKLRLGGAPVPKLKPPPGAAVGAGAIVTWTLVGPKLNPPNELPDPIVAVAVDAAAAVGAAAGWDGA